MITALSSFTSFMTQTLVIARIAQVYVIAAAI